MTSLKLKTVTIHFVIGRNGSSVVTIVIAVILVVEVIVVHLSNENI